MTHQCGCWVDLNRDISYCELHKAAPEMLAALEAILPLALQFSNGYDDQLAQVHAALAAAGGQEVGA